MPSFDPTQHPRRRDGTFTPTLGGVPSGALTAPARPGDLDLHVGNSRVRVHAWHEDDGPAGWQVDEESAVAVMDAWAGENDRRSWAWCFGEGPSYIAVEDEHGNESTVEPWDEDGNGWELESLCEATGASPTE